MNIINGKKIGTEILEELKTKVHGLNFVPKFCDVLVGEDMASLQYVNLKKKKAEELGIEFYDANLPQDISTFELLQEIDKLNRVENMCGIIIQLPLPSNLDTKQILDAIDPALDVDALGSKVSERFYAGDENIVPPTALACLKLLEDFNLSEKQIVVIGEGKLVGRPVAQLLKNRGLNFQSVNSQTLNKEEIIKNADVVISGVGKGKFITGDMIKDGVIIIDAGTSEEGGSIVGDVDFESVSKKALAVTPVPGGVGPVTVAMLFLNVLKVAQKIQNQQ